MNNLYICIDIYPSLCSLLALIFHKYVCENWSVYPFKCRCRIHAGLEIGHHCTCRCFFSTKLCQTINRRSDYNHLDMCSLKCISLSPKRVQIGFRRSYALLQYGRHDFTRQQTNNKENIGTPYCWPFVRGIHRWPVVSPHKGPVIFMASFRDGDEYWMISASVPGERVVVSVVDSALRRTDGCTEVYGQMRDGVYRMFRVSDSSTLRLVKSISHFKLRKCVHFSFKLYQSLFALVWLIVSFGVGNGLTARRCPW